MAQPSLKRTLSAISDDIAENEARAKRLKKEYDEHPDLAAHLLAEDHAKLKKYLPDFMYDALVVSPSALQLEKYGTLRELNFARNLGPSGSTIEAVFEKDAVGYVTHGRLDDQIRVDFPPEHADKPMTQQVLWKKALCLNDDDVAAACIVVLRDAVELMSKLICYPPSPLKEAEIYRRVQAKLPHVTPEDLAELYARPGSQARIYRYKAEIERDPVAWAATVNRTRKIYPDF